MIILGIICLLLGYFLAIQLLWIIGIILVIVGVVLMLVGTVGHRQVGGRSHWY
jgi:hypothetical protein